MFIELIKEIYTVQNKNYILEVEIYNNILEEIPKNNFFHNLSLSGLYIYKSVEYNYIIL